MEDASLHTPDDFVLTLVRGFFVGSAKAYLQFRSGNMLPSWNHDRAPIPEHLAQEVFYYLKAPTCMKANRDAWEALQYSQHKTHLVQYIVNGGKNPCPRSGFLNCWLVAANKAGVSPMFYLENLLALAMSSIDITQATVMQVLEVTNTKSQYLATRGTLRAFISILFGRPGFTIPHEESYPTTMIETFVAAHPKWKNKVSFAGIHWVSMREISLICQEICGDDDYCKKMQAYAEQAQEPIQFTINKMGQVDYHDNGNTFPTEFSPAY